MPKPEPTIGWTVILCHSAGNKDQREATAASPESRLARSKNESAEKLAFPEEIGMSYNGYTKVSSTIVNLIMALTNEREVV